MAIDRRHENESSNGRVATGVATTDARARRSVGTIFFLNGAVLASWIPHIPVVKQQHGMSEGTLGLVLLRA